jgi:hypothetical protein
MHRQDITWTQAPSGKTDNRIPAATIRYPLDERTAQLDHLISMNKILALLIFIYGGNFFAASIYMESISRETVL